MENILISVIIPVYNAEKYIEQCLFSILNNSYRNLEIICVNDGSTDNSLEILEKIASLDSRIVLINGTNSGVSSARNKGIRIASGSYIAFVDADDWVHCDYFKLLLHAAIHENTEIAICDWKACGEFHNETDHGKEIEVQPYSVTNEQVLKNRLIRNRPWGKLFKKEFLKDFWFPESIRFGEDAIFSMLVLSQADNFTIAKIDLPLYFYYTENLASLSHDPDNEKMLRLAQCYFESLKVVGRTDYCLSQAMQTAMHYRYMGSFSCNRKIVKLQAKQFLCDCSIQLLKDQYMPLKEKIALLVAAGSPVLFRLALIMRDPSYLKWEKMQRQKNNSGEAPNDKDSIPNP